ncbi:RICIN domain-containing protein [Streptomyces olivoreticuli]|uniref:RICIN domain-containing protein n=1 Tax=Streptomyces olivoreticuli TaxID=68246 RepID=UPI00265875F8|nr:RICIN domain-containing protein [Streptomyces olivoreticuli]WKK20887.1 RICIN domain-containing protein [Streptomyces olivoreticuli]
MSVSAKTTYLIRNDETGLYLTAKGAAVVQERLHAWPPRAGQAWRLEPGQGGRDTYRVRNQRSGRYLQVRRYGEGTAVGQAPLNESAPAYRSQTWRISGDADEGAPVVNVHSELRLTVRDGATAEGAVIEQTRETVAARAGAQRWHFEAVEQTGGTRAFDALAGLVVEPGTGGIVSTATSVLKTAMEATGGVVGAVSKWVPGSDRTPYIRFDGFRDDEVVRFSRRNRVETERKKISEAFPHLPKEFHGGFDFVTRTPRGHRYPYLGVKGDLAVEFSDREGEDLLPADDYFPAQELRPRAGRRFKAVSAAPDGSSYLVFGERGTVVVDRPGSPYEREVREVELGHLPKEFGGVPDAVASAGVGEETHFFATKGDRCLVFSLREVIQGPAEILDAWPFLLGAWL